MRYDQKVALITGCADGIAAAAARIILNEGGAVFGFDRNWETPDQTLVASVPNGSNKFCTYTGDGLNQADVNAAAQKALSTFGHIDILINAIGGSTVIKNTHTPLEQLSLEEWETLINFNLRTTFLFCQAVIPIMKAQRSGKIVNLSSHAARGIDVASTAYAAAKAGIIGLTRKLAMEVGPYGITCNATAPSRTLTNRLKHTTEAGEHRADDSYLQRIPLRRLATAEDQARVVCFLSSSDADYVSGVTIDVNGGQ